MESQLPTGGNVRVQDDVLRFVVVVVAADAGIPDYTNLSRKRFVSCAAMVAVRNAMSFSVGAVPG